MIKLSLLVFIGGGIGSTVRFLLHHACNKLWPSQFSIGTLIINILGSTLIGLCFALAAKSFINENTRVFLMVGICGGFTTFSAFSLENFHLIRAGETLYWMGYIILSVLLCIAGVWLGDGLGKTLIGN